MHLRVSLYWAHIRCTTLQTFIFLTFQFFSKISGLIRYYSICHRLMALAVQIWGNMLTLKKKMRKYSERFEDFSFAVLTFLISERQFEHSSWDFIRRALFVNLYLPFQCTHSYEYSFFFFKTLGNICSQEVQNSILNYNIWWDMHLNLQSCWFWKEPWQC